MPVVRRPDDHRVDILAIQNLAIVARRENVRPPQLLAVLQPPVIAIGHSHQLHAWHRHRRLCVELPLPTRTDQRNLNMIVCRHRRRLFRLLDRQRMHPRPG